MTHPPPRAADELAAHARSVIDRISYLTLGTTDEFGRPWTSPVFFAASGEWQFYWQSAIDARHSRNIAAHPQISLVIFDSTVLPYHGRAVYAAGTAVEVPGKDLHQALQVYPGPPGRGGTPVHRADVTAPAPYRLYRATASDVWVLCPRPPRQPCPLHGLATDHRTPVWLPSGGPLEPDADPH